MVIKISKKRKSEESDLIRKLESDERKMFGIEHKVTKRKKVYWTSSYPHSDDKHMVIVLDMNWKEFFRDIPNFKVEVINGKLNLESDKKVRSRKNGDANV